MSVSSASYKLIVGLGNPGQKYEGTRHNIGMLLLEDLADKYKTSMWSSKCKGDYLSCDLFGSKVFLLKPQTYMNLSGESVASFMNFFKIDLSSLLVIHDEIDLPFGEIMFKDGGGLAGHNGLKSIASLLGTQNFLRLRVGVGRPKHEDVSDWVLSEFSKDEKKSLASISDFAFQYIEDYLKEGKECALRNCKRRSVLDVS